MAFDLFCLALAELLLYARFRNCSEMEIPRNIRNRWKFEENAQNTANVFNLLHSLEKNDLYSHIVCELCKWNALHCERDSIVAQIKESPLIEDLCAHS